jgi:hypothetical protein
MTLSRVLLAGVLVPHSLVRERQADEASQLRHLA